MAIRNAVRIDSYIERQKANLKKKVDDFWLCVNILSESRGDAIDLLDTMRYIREKNLGDEVDKFENNFNESLQRVTSKYMRYHTVPSRGEIILILDWNTATTITYKPKEDSCVFSHYPFKFEYKPKVGDDDLLDKLTTENFGNAVKEMATTFQPFIEAFFKWVDEL